MNLCSEGHDDVCYEVRRCPVCKAIAKLEDIRDEIIDAKDRIDRLKDALDKCQDALDKCQAEQGE